MLLSFAASRLSFEQLVRIGVHVGHSLSNTSLFAAWMVLGFRQGLCLIDLFRFVHMLRFGFNVIDLLVGRSRPIWFVNKEQIFERFIRYFATKCGEFSSTFL